MLKRTKCEVNQSKQKERDERVECYLRCKLSCNCDDDVCMGSGLKQCQQCKEIMKSQCTKKKCKEGGIIPVMIPVYYDVNKKSRRKNTHSDKPSYKQTI